MLLISEKNSEESAGDKKKQTNKKTCCQSFSTSYEDILLSQRVGFCKISSL